jgi:hypothetical protein
VKNRKRNAIFKIYSILRMQTSTRLANEPTKVEQPARRFPPPWSVDELDACFAERDHSGQALAYLYSRIKRRPPVEAASKLLLVAVIAVVAMMVAVVVMMVAVAVSPSGRTILSHGYRGSAQQ